MARGMSDDTRHWRLADDGRWIRHHLDADGQPLHGPAEPSSSRCTPSGAARPAGGDRRLARAPAPRASGRHPRRRRAGARACRGAAARAACRSPWCTAPGTTTGPGPRASSTPARSGPSRPCARSQEETGWPYASGGPLPTSTYTCSDRDRRPATKEVRYWAAEVIGGDGILDNEIDEVAWLDVVSALDPPGLRPRPRPAARAGARRARGRRSPPGRSRVIRHATRHTAWRLVR